MEKMQEPHLTGRKWQGRALEDSSQVCIGQGHENRVRSSHSPWVKRFVLPKPKLPFP